MSAPLTADQVAQYAASNADIPGLPGLSSFTAGWGALSDFVGGWAATFTADINGYTLYVNALNIQGH